MNIANTLKHEFKKILPPTLFFMVCFNLIVLTVALMSEQRGHSLVDHATATMAGLLVGKAVLVSDMLPFFNRYPSHPLIYNTVWKALLYFAVTFLFRLAERLIGAATNEYGFSAGIAEEVGHFDWPTFWAVQLWLAILFLIYTGTREAINAIGGKRVYEMFFVTPPAKAG